MIVGSLARAALPLAVFFTLVPGLLLLAEKPGTAGFSITAFTVILGALLLVASVATLVLTRRRTADQVQTPVATAHHSEKGDRP